MISPGNGLVPSGNKPLPEPMLTQIFVTIMVSLGHNELKIHLLSVIECSAFENVDCEMADILSRGMS